jgi:hypothetical protein
MSVLIMATGGFSVYHHFCHCEGEMTDTFFRPNTCEHQSVKAVHSCCALKETKSCCAGKPGKERRQTYHRDKCCNTTAQYFKISDSFQTAPAKISLSTVEFIAVLFLVDIQEYIDNSFRIKLDATGLPPPDTARDILVSHHQLKLDTPLA